MALPVPSREPVLPLFPLANRSASTSTERFLTLVRDALLHLHDLPYLQSHQLAREIPPDLVARGGGSGKALRQSLTDAIEGLRPPRDASPQSHAWRTYELFRQRYLEGLSTGDVQAKLGISRSAYHRDHRAALEGLAVLLQARWGAEAEPGVTRALAAAERAMDQGEPVHGAPSHNLPRARTSFVGRERELAEVRRLLGSSRLVTLTGAGGCGKTRLAIELGRGLASEFDEGVWFVGLGALADPSLVAETAIAALGVSEQVGQPTLNALVGHLRHRNLLLILDNCEHLLDACARLADSLLEACPSLRVLATSRQSLGIGGETVWRVPSLATPPAEGSADAEILAGYQSVRLFADRARSVVPAFSLTPDHATAVAEICRRLDGIPLAIELAAARASALSPEQIASRLDHDFHLLTGGSRTALPRQQTLKATLDWSHDLLAEGERVLFRRLSVFAGGFRLEAAEQVCSGEGIAEPEVLDLLIQLVGKSLVEAETHEESARYRLLEPVHQYAWHRLEEASEMDAVQRKHASWCVEYVQPDMAEDYGPEEAAWLRRVAPEQDNVRAALRWCVDHDPEMGLILASRMWRYWQFQRYDSERRRWVEEMLPRASGRTHARMMVLWFRAMDALDQGAYDRATSLAEESLDICLEIGNLSRAFAAYGILLHAALEQGDTRRASALLREGESVARRSGDRTDLALELWHRADVAWVQGDYPRARSLAEVAVGLFRETGVKHGIANSLVMLGRYICSEGEYPRARVCLDEALVLSRALEDPPTIALALTGLGQAALGEGDHDRAEACLSEALRLLHPFGHRQRMSRIMCFLAILASRQGDAARAVRLVGSAEALNRFYRFSLAPNEHADVDTCLTAARAVLGESAFDRAFAQGQAMNLSQAVEHALSENA